MHVFGEEEKLADKQAWPAAIGLDGRSGLFQNCTYCWPIPGFLEEIGS